MSFLNKYAVLIIIILLIVIFISLISLFVYVKKHNSKSNNNSFTNGKDNNISTRVSLTTTTTNNNNNMINKKNTEEAKRLEELDNIKKLFFNNKDSYFKNYWILFELLKDDVKNSHLLKNEINKAVNYINRGDKAKARLILNLDEFKSPDKGWQFFTELISIHRSISSNQSEWYSWMNNFVALNAFFFDDTIKYNKEIIERNKNVWLVFEQKLPPEQDNQLPKRIDLLIITKYNNQYCCEIIELKQLSRYENEDIDKKYAELMKQMYKYRKGILNKYPDINVHEKALMYNMDNDTIKKLNNKYNADFKSKNNSNNKDNYFHKFFNLGGSDKFIAYLNAELNLDKEIDQFSEEELIKFLNEI